jgi:hypothetical protein
MFVKLKCIKNYFLTSTYSALSESEQKSKSSDDETEDRAELSDTGSGLGLDGESELGTASDHMSMISVSSVASVRSQDGKNKGSQKLRKSATRKRKSAAQGSDAQKAPTAVGSGEVIKKGNIHLQHTRALLLNLSIDEEDEEERNRRRKCRCVLRVSLNGRS